MLRISLDFDMSDALMTQAVREDCIAVARPYAKLSDVLVVLASTGVFALAMARESHWLWWFAGLPVLLYALFGVGWLVAFLWMPGAARSRLARLPHRRVRVEATDEALIFQTANERLEVVWSELKALKRRPNFWIFCLRSGARIPIPSALLPADAVSFLESKLA
jgi:hypothetical protein